MAYGKSDQSIKKRRRKSEKGESDDVQRRAEDYIFRPVSELILLVSDDGEDLKNKDSISLGEECDVH